MMGMHSFDNMNYRAPSEDFIFKVSVPRIARFLKCHETDQDINTHVLPLANNEKSSELRISMADLIAGARGTSLSQGSRVCHKILDNYPHIAKHVRYLRFPKKHQHIVPTLNADGVDALLPFIPGSKAEIFRMVYSKSLLHYLRTGRILETIEREDETKDAHTFHPQPKCPDEQPSPQPSPQPWPLSATTETLTDVLKAVEATVVALHAAIEARKAVAPETNENDV